MGHAEPRRPLHGDQGVGVTASASPAGMTVGALALLGSTVTNHGLESNPVTFTDTIPSGLRIESVFAGGHSVRRATARRLLSPLGCKAGKVRHLTAGRLQRAR